MKKAIVIDDALLPPPRAKLVELRDEIVRVAREEDALAEWFKDEFKLSGKPGTDAFWDPLFVSATELARLWELRAKSPLGERLTKEVFSTLETEVTMSAKPLFEVKRHLEQCGYEVAMHGAIPESIDAALGAEIVVIDYIIDPAVGPASARESERFLAELSQKRRTDVDGFCPFVFLVSTAGQLMEGNAPEFRQRSKIPESFFRFVHKTNGNGFRAFKWQLDRYLDSREVLRSYYGFQRSYLAALQSAYENLKSKVEGLEVADLATLQATQLEEEKKPLGEYLAWLSSAYLQAKISEDRGVPATTDLLPKAAGAIYVGHLGPSDQITQMFANAAVHRPGVAENRIASETDVDLRFGDMFFSVPTKEGEVPVAMLLISQTCDILQGKLGETVLMLEGKLSRVEDGAYARFRVTVEQMKDSDVVLARHLGIDYRIQWFAKRVRTVDATALKKQNGFEYVGVLNTIYALQAQNRFLHDTGRIGVPIRPLHQGSFTRVKIRVIDEAAGIDGCIESDSHVWAVILPDGSGKLQLVLTPELCILVRETLEERKNHHTNADLLGRIDALDRVFSCKAVIVHANKNGTSFERIEADGALDGLSGLKLWVAADGITDDAANHSLGKRRVEIVLGARA